MALPDAGDGAAGGAGSAGGDGAPIEGKRSIQRLATGLLVAVTIVFIAAVVLERSHEWVVWIRVTAEAAMIGALADWFAVTALFRHPLGIPIPHTAIIPNRKNQIGIALGTFIQSNFLTTDNVLERIRNADAANRIGQWLEDPENVDQVAHQLTEGIAAVVASLDDEQLSEAVRDTVTERLAAVELAPMASRALALATADGRHQDLVDAFLPELARSLDTNRASLLKAVAETSPWWVPRGVDEAVLDKALDVAHRFIQDVAADRNHPFRHQVDDLSVDLIERLRTDPELIARGEQLKQDLIGHAAVQTYLAGLWDDTKRAILEQSNDPNSALRERVSGSIAAFGRGLRTDPVLQERCEIWLERIAIELVARFQGEISSIVTTTVERWDARETSDRMEELLGRDLQYIRISGTVVGGLAGLTIYTLSRLI